MGKTAKFLRAGKTKKDLERIRLYFKARNDTVETSKSATKVINTNPKSSKDEKKQIEKIMEKPLINKSRKRSRIQDNECDDLMDLDDQQHTRKIARVGADLKRAKVLEGRVDYVTLMESKLKSSSLQRELKLNSTRETLKNRR